FFAAEARERRTVPAPQSMEGRRSEDLSQALRGASGILGAQQDEHTFDAWRCPEDFFQKRLADEPGGARQQETLAREPIGGNSIPRVVGCQRFGHQPVAFSQEVCVGPYPQTAVFDSVRAPRFTRRCSGGPRSTPARGSRWTPRRAGGGCRGS